MIEDIEKKLLGLIGEGRETRIWIAVNPSTSGPGLWASPEDQELAKERGLVWSCSWNVSDSPKHLMTVKVYASSFARLLDAVGAHVS